MEEREKYMKAALRQAKLAAKEGEVPVGCVIVKDGEIIARASADKEEILIAECDLAVQREFRRIWPFFRDRRIDAYGDITKRLRD